METTTKLESMRTKISDYLNALIVANHPPVEECIQRIIAELDTPETSKQTLQHMATLKSKGYLIVESRKDSGVLTYVYEFALGEKREDVIDRHLAYLDKAMLDFQASRNLNMAVVE